MPRATAESAEQVAADAAQVASDATAAADAADAEAALRQTTETSEPVDVNVVVDAVADAPDLAVTAAQTDEDVTVGLNHLDD